MKRGERRSGERGRNRSHPASVRGRYGLGGVDHPAPAQRDDVGAADLLAHPGGDVGHQPQRCEGELPCTGSDETLRVIAEGPSGREERVLLKARLPQQLGRGEEQPPPEPDLTLTVAEGELAQAVGAGSVSSAGSRWSCFSPAPISATALLRALR